MKNILVLLLLLCATAFAQSTTPQMFGVNLNPGVLSPGKPIPWPAFRFGALRLWGTQSTWNDLNPSQDVYDFSQLDSWFAITQEHNVGDLIYTFGVVPQWASSKPDDQTCVSRYSPPGSCDAPNDLNADGTGPDLLWQKFVTAIVTHAAGRIKYWEVWNESDVPMEWSGTYAQSVRMAKDAYAIIKQLDPESLVTTPSSVNAGGGHSIGRWLPGYLAAGGAAYADITAYHGYIDPAMGESPETEITTFNTVMSAIAGTALAAKPVWDTEGSWGDNTKLPDADMQAAYVSRMYLLQASLGIPRFYWFQYGDTQLGTLLDSDGVTLNPAGVAYEESYHWVSTAKILSPCSASGTVWTCAYSRPDGSNYLAVWDAAQSCSNGDCTTSQYSYPRGYSRFHTLASDLSTSLQGGEVAIGAKPILLKSFPRP